MNEDLNMNVSDKTLAEGLAVSVAYTLITVVEVYIGYRIIKGATNIITYKLAKRRFRKIGA